MSFLPSRNLQCLSLPEYTSVHPLHVSILRLIISFSLPSLREFSFRHCCPHHRAPPERRKICLRLAIDGWGGEPGGNRTTIFGPAIKSWEVRHCLTWFLLFQASHSRKIPDRKGEKAEWRTIPSRCLKTPSSSCCAVFISEIRGPCLQRPLTAV